MCRSQGPESSLLCSELSLEPQQAHEPTCSLALHKRLDSRLRGLHKHQRQWRQRVDSASALYCKICWRHVALPRGRPESRDGPGRVRGSQAAPAEAVCAAFDLRRQMRMHLLRFAPRRRRHRRFAARAPIRRLGGASWGARRDLGPGEGLNSTVTLCGELFSYTGHMNRSIRSAQVSPSEDCYGLATAAKPCIRKCFERSIHSRFDSSLSVWMSFLWCTIQSSPTGRGACCRSRSRSTPCGRIWMAPSGRRRPCHCLPPAAPR